MSNYVQTTFFTPKDTLPSTNPAKTIYGAAYDVEFGNIATAINSKYDSSSIAANPVAFGLGSAANPSIYFGAATTAGFYGDGASGIGIATANGAVMQLAASGAVTISTPTAATALTVNGAAGQSTITATVATGQAASINVFSSGAGSATVNFNVGGIITMNAIANNSGSPINGIATGSCGLNSIAGAPLVFCVGSAVRLSLGAAANVAASYNFAQCLTSTSASPGSAGALPAQVSGYWNMLLNGVSLKIPYYNV